MLLETLDILSDLIRSYGNSLAPFHDPLVKALMPLLVDPKPVSVRKRAYTVLCEFNTVEPLSKNEDTSLIRTTFLSPRTVLASRKFAQSCNLQTKAGLK